MQHIGGSDTVGSEAIVSEITLREATDKMPELTNYIRDGARFNRFERGMESSPVQQFVKIMSIVSPNTLALPSILV